MSFHQKAFDSCALRAALMTQLPHALSASVEMPTLVLSDEDASAFADAVADLARECAASVMGRPHVLGAAAPSLAAGKARKKVSAAKSKKS